MGNKVKDEQIAVVRSVVGQDFSEMDIIRALHMANNDAAAAINIIFDTPHLRLSGETTGARKRSPPRPAAAPDRKDVATNSDLVQRTLHNPREPETDSLGSSKPADETTPVPKDSDWLLVGSSDLAGLSTCKGRRLKAGDKVTFSFPSEKSLSCPSTGKFPSRGRSVASCSEIVRFSTAESGEVLFAAMWNISDNILLIQEALHPI